MHTFNKTTPAAISFATTQGLFSLADDARVADALRFARKRFPEFAREFCNAQVVRTVAQAYERSGDYYNEAPGVVALIVGEFLSDGRFGIVYLNGGAQQSENGNKYYQWGGVRYERATGIAEAQARVVRWARKYRRPVEVEELVAA